VRDLVVGTQRTHTRNASDERLECADECTEVAVVVEMIREHRGDDGVVRRQLEEGSVALVGFDHEPLARVEHGVRADLVQITADEEARAPARRAQDEREHRRRGRLPVAPRDRNGGARRHDRTQRVGPPQHRYATLAGRHHFGIALGDRGGDDDRIERVGEVGRVVPDVGRDPEDGKPFERWRWSEVGAAHGVAHAGEHGRDRAHAGTTDPDDVDRVRSGEVE
jgi:hypothetical protein